MSANDSTASGPTLDHPAFKLVKGQFPGKKFKGTEFRGCSTLIVEKADLHGVLAFLKSDPRADFNFLVDIAYADYLNYPSPTIGRFALIYCLMNHSRDERFYVKVFMDASLPTEGIVDDPALHVPTVTDLWPGAEWMEREAFDMVGIRFDGHPDLRRILTWESYPAHPLRKDYPLRGRGERDMYKVLDRTSA